jgi:hypothetical protein
MLPAFTLSGLVGTLSLPAVVNSDCRAFKGQFEVSPLQWCQAVAWDTAKMCNLAVGTEELPWSYSAFDQASRRSDMSVKPNRAHRNRVNPGHFGGAGGPMRTSPCKMDDTRERPGNPGPVPKFLTFLGLDRAERSRTERRFTQRLVFVPRGLHCSGNGRGKGCEGTSGRSGLIC